MKYGISGNATSWSLRLGLILLTGVYIYAAIGVLQHKGRKTGEASTPVIRFAHWQIEGGLREAMDAVAESYMTKFPGVEVRQMAVPGGIYTQWLRTQLIGGTAPDLLVMGFWVGGVEELLPRFFIPITRWVEQPNPHNAGTILEDVPWKDTFTDGLQANETYNRQLRQYYAATMCMLAIRMFYNRDLLIEITGEDTPPTNLDGFLDLTRQIRRHAHSAGLDLVPIAGARLNAQWILSPIANGATTRFSLEMDRYHRARHSLFEQATYFFEGDWSYNSPDFQGAIELMRLIGNEMKPGFLQLERDDAVQQFLRRQAVMVGTGSWDVGSLTLMAPFDIGTFRLPMPDPEDPVFGHQVLGPIADSGYGTAVPFFLTNQSPHPDLAIHFLQYMTSFEGNGIFARKSGWTPSIIGVEPREDARAFAINLEGYYFGHQVAFWPTPEGVRLWMTNLHRLFGRQGSTESFIRTLELQAPTAIKADAELTLRTYRQQWRRQDPALAAWRQLPAHNLADGPAVAQEQISSQHLTEARAYILQMAMREHDRVLR